MAATAGGRLTTALAVVVVAVVAVPVARRLGLGPVRGCGGINQPPCKEPGKVRASGGGGALAAVVAAATETETDSVGGCGGVNQPKCK
ncbi:hypothetical protein [Kitasatospora sp. NPDC088346]|uniref:hypothetical protein n=1 Tax=Kitasatospora sp. NPDC088346 TaxID=3364073 RepID=UPI003820A59C